MPAIALTLSPALAQFLAWAIFGLMYHYVMILLVKICND